MRRIDTPPVISTALLLRLPASATLQRQQQLLRTPINVSTAAVTMKTSSGHHSGGRRSPARGSPSYTESRETRLRLEDAQRSAYLTKHSNRHGSMHSECVTYLQLEIESESSRLAGNSVASPVVTHCSPTEKLAILLTISRMCSRSLPKLRGV